MITDVTDPRELSGDAAGNLYRRRWGIEVSFRSLKQTLARRKVRSCAACNARREPAWSIVGLWTLSLLGGRAIRRAGHAVDRLSVAHALAAVRLPTRRDLWTRLRCAVRDTYRRHSPKRAYNRAQKKAQRPSGEPVVTAATEAQIQAATRLRKEIRTP